MTLGRRVQPNLPGFFDNCEQLDIQSLEWAGHAKQRGGDRYEFIGEYDALMALGCVSAPMLDVGVSGKKSGAGFYTQKLANDRFRLELYDVKIGPVIAAALGTPEPAPPARQDHMSSSLAKASSLVGQYPPKLRSKLYSGLCDSAGNGWQLIESFPWLAVRVFVLEDATAAHARSLVRRGAKLRVIAEAAQVPMCFKRFEPKTAKILIGLADLLSRHTDTVSHHCPEKWRRQKSWLSVIAKAYENGNEDFAMWVAVHWEELAGTPNQIRSVVGNLNDWMGACAVEQAALGIEVGHIEGICQAMLIADRTEAEVGLREWWQSVGGAAEAGRPFNNKMAPQTVLKLSDEWHERAAETKAADVAFPDPWYEGGTVGSFQIEPIRTAPELGRYAYRLHNCAATYAHRIAAGRIFLYVVLVADIPQAMLQLERDGDGTSFGQLMGPHNDDVPGELRTAVGMWFKAA